MCTQTTDRSFSTILLTQDGYDVIKGLGTDTKEDIQRSSTVIQSGFTLALSDNLRTLTLSAEHKRKSLTLSLTPLGLAAATHTDQQRETAFTDSCQNEPCSSSTVLKGEAGDLEKEPNHLMSNGTSARCSRTQKRRNQEKNSFLLKEGQEKVKSGPQRRERGRRTVQSHTRNMCVSTHQQQEVTGRELSGCALEAVEVMDGGPVSPIHLTINRLLGWGERLLLGVLLGPHVKVGHAALPYRC
ncbi:hypothetical protein Q7C36_017805 [Tachysurus vachellii]|uniref:Uncharacterized protein n=1 Tax=Tachysurus vachellii TaxID=175792 RepID=A0AA88M6R6_TACVA|nr:hypothetical protein Q7C36_017805 [Tachysurus vachellii]